MPRLPSAGRTEGRTLVARCWGYNPVLAMSLAPGSSLGPYAILAELSHGGMEVVSDEELHAMINTLSVAVGVNVTTRELAKEQGG